MKKLVCVWPLTNVVLINCYNDFQELKSVKSLQCYLPAEGASDGEFSKWIPRKSWSARISAPVASTLVRSAGVVMAPFFIGLFPVGGGEGSAIPLMPRPFTPVTGWLWVLVTVDCPYYFGKRSHLSTPAWPLNCDIRPAGPPPFVLCDLIFPPIDSSQLASFFPLFPHRLPFGC